MQLSGLDVVSHSLQYMPFISKLSFLTVLMWHAGAGKYPSLREGRHLYVYESQENYPQSEFNGKVGLEYLPRLSDEHRS